MVPCCRDRQGVTAAGAAGAEGDEDAVEDAASRDLTTVLSFAGTPTSPGCQRTSFAVVVAAAAVAVVAVVAAVVVPTVQVQHLLYTAVYNSLL